MHTLRNWRAKRAGGRITVYGETPEGKPDKVVGVDSIHPPPFPTDKFVLAVDRAGVHHQLLL